MNRIPTARATRAAVAVLAVAGLALAGCSSTNGTGTTSTGSATVDIAAGSVGDVSQFASIADVCGSTDKPVTVGFVDGYGTNTWSKTVKAEVESEAAKCPQIKSVEYAAGRGDLAATTSAITSMAAKGIDIIMVIPDAGPGEAAPSALRGPPDRKARLRSERASCSPVAVTSKRRQ